MVTEEEIRQWVRDEKAKILVEEQEQCKHLKSGTLYENNIVVCDQCKKPLKYMEK